MKAIGIVGAGIIGKSHKNALMKNSGCTIAAICDVNREKAEILAEGTGAHVYTDYREMCKEEKLDAVILNLPHFLHKEVSVYFLEHKVAVLVEKPMANTVGECDAMIDASQKNRTPLAVGHVQKYYACYRKLREMMETGELGKLCSFTETRNTDYFTNRPRWFLNKSQAGGGMIMNYGAHTLDKLFYVTRCKVENVHAIGSNMLTEDDVEASAQILLKLSDRVSASCSYHGCHVPNQYDTYFYFTEGAAWIKWGTELWIARGKTPFERVELDYDRDIFDFQLSEFIKLLEGEDSDAVTPEYGREIIRILEDISCQISGE